MVFPGGGFGLVAPSSDRGDFVRHFSDRSASVLALVHRFSDLGGFNSHFRRHPPSILQNLCGFIKCKRKTKRNIYYAWFSNRYGL